MRRTERPLLHGRLLASKQRADSAWEFEVLTPEGRRSFSALPGEKLALDPGGWIRAELDEEDRIIRLWPESPRLAWKTPPEGDGLRWDQPCDQGLTRRRILYQRQRIIRAVREFFFGEGFLEIQAPLLIKGTCPDPGIDSIPAADGYLTTSTEYQIKRMMAGGFDKVFTLTQNFRDDPPSGVHNPEFTMLEWARAFETLAAIEADAQQLIQRAFESLHPGEERLLFRGRRIRIRGVPWPQLTVRDALKARFGMDVDGGFSLEALRLAMVKAGVEAPEALTANALDLFSYLLDEAQRELGFETPVFLCGWPAWMTSSAPAGSSPAVAERSELIIGGLEISDGFPFLRDPDEQARQFAEKLKQRHELNKPLVLLDERYLESLRRGLPPGAGMALGMDRLVMALTGQSSIRSVLPFAWDER